MGIVKRDSIAITVLSYVGVVVGYVNKILLFPNFLSEEQVGLTSILVSLAVMYAQFSALGINSTVVKFFPFSARRTNVTTASSSGRHWGSASVSCSSRRSS